LGDPDTKTENWRGGFFFYGALGLIAGAIFLLVTRDSPTKHPWAKDAEAARVPPPPKAPGDSASWLQRLGALIYSPNMWLFGVSQFCVNVGWAFLITNLPGYLGERFAVDLKEVGQMQTVALTIGCIGMALGGLFADLMYRS